MFSELELRRQRGSLSQDALVLTVQDRQEPLGSGGATLNALLVAAEHLSSRAGHTVSDTIRWDGPHSCPKVHSGSAGVFSSGGDSGRPG